jgi:hypothetical protein
LRSRTAPCNTGSDTLSQGTLDYARRGRRWTRYRVPEPQAAATAPAPAKEGKEAVPLSKASIEGQHRNPSLSEPKHCGTKAGRLRPSVPRFLPAECHVLSFRGTACPPCEGRDAEFRRSGGRHVCKTDSEPSQLKLPSTGEVAYSAGTPRPCRRRPAAN